MSLLTVNFERKLFLSLATNAKKLLATEEQEHKQEKILSKKQIAHSLQEDLFTFQNLLDSLRLKGTVTAQQYTLYEQKLSEIWNQIEGILSK